VVVAVVVVGGDAPNGAVPTHLPSPRLTIAADSGYDHARRLGLDVDVLVGDLDSISAAGLADAQARAVAIERHRPDKDQTDTELAIACAVARGAARIVGVSGGGDRPDHAWSTLLAFAAAGLVGHDVSVWWERALVSVVRAGTPRVLDGEIGSLVSLLPVHGDVEGVRTSGLVYPLHGERLPAGTGRGISNLVETAPATVSVDRGTLLVVQPDVLPAVARRYMPTPDPEDPQR
jgi:thiamine pyrophosphokinase